MKEKHEYKFMVILVLFLLKENGEAKANWITKKTRCIMKIIVFMFSSWIM